MKMTKGIFSYIDKSIGHIMFEIGGILGSHGNEPNDTVIIDTPLLPPIRACSYSPNVEYFNYCIADWQRSGIIFKGIFHTHFAGVQSLSESDETYIKRIMLTMPNELQYLFFPIFVLPERKFVSYIAYRKNSQVKICLDETFII